MNNRKVNDFLYEQESYKLRGACFNVFNELGGAIKENIIERAITKELKDIGFTVENQKRIDVSYKNEKIGIYMPDLVLNEKIIIELKSKPFITASDEKQFWGYLQGSEYKLGFLINFGPQKLTIKRFAHSKN